MAERQLLRWKIMEIISVVSKVQTKELQSSNGPFEIRYQEADLIMPNRRARALEIRAPRDGEYPPGLYTLAAESFSTNHWDQLGVESHREGYGPGAKYVWHAWRPDPAGTGTRYQPVTWGVGCGVQ